MPDELTTAAASPASILAIGFCLLSDLLHKLPGCIKQDFILANEIGRFPGEPPGDMAGYDYQIIQIPLRVIIRDLTFNTLAYDDEAGFARAFERCRTALRLHLETRLRWNVSYGTLTFVMNFMELQSAMRGRFHPRFDLRNIGYFVARLNEEMETVLRGYSNVFVFDLDKLTASFGRCHVLQAFLADDGRVVAYEAQDRYTPYGLVGVILLRGHGVTQWVMSCRVIGMGVEQSVMHTLVTALRNANANTITADLVATDVNQPCQELFRSAGFAQAGDQWAPAGHSTPPAPPFVAVTVELD